VRVCQVMEGTSASFAFSASLLTVSQFQFRVDVALLPSDRVAMALPPHRA